MGLNRKLKNPHEPKYKKTSSSRLSSIIFAATVWSRFRCSSDLGTTLIGSSSPKSAVGSYRSPDTDFRPRPVRFMYCNAICSSSICSSVRDYKTRSELSNTLPVISSSSLLSFSGSANCKPPNLIELFLPSASSRSA